MPPADLFGSCASPTCWFTFRVHETGWLGKRDRMRPIGDAPATHPGDDLEQSAACMNPYCDREGTIQITVFGTPVGWACSICVPVVDVTTISPVLEIIVRDLAASDPTNSDGDNPDQPVMCELCAQFVQEGEPHRPSCPWRRAREWVEAHDG